MLCETCEAVELEVLYDDEEFELDVDFQGEIIDSGKIEKVEINDSGELVFTFIDGTIQNLGVVVGKDGEILNSIIVDTELNSESSNPVANYVLVNKFDEYVPIERTVAGISLWDNISADKLKQALSIYPVLIAQDGTRLQDIEGRYGQFLIYRSERSGTTLYRYGKYDGGSNSYWEKILSDKNLSYEPYGSPNSPPTHRANWGDMIFQNISNNQALWMCVYVDTSEQLTPMWVRIPVYSNIVTKIDENSTDVQIPSAKLFYDTVGDIETLLANI